MDSSLRLESEIITGVFFTQMVTSNISARWTQIEMGVCLGS